MFSKCYLAYFLHFAYNRKKEPKYQEEDFIQVVEAYNRHRSDYKIFMNTVLGKFFNETSKNFANKEGFNHFTEVYKIAEEIEDKLKNEKNG